VFNVIAQHGYDGLLLATLMAGAMLLAAGFMRFGTWIKYIPEPVVIGFTAGIAVIIFTSQLKDLFGLQPDSLPAEFLPKVEALWSARETLDAATFAIAAAALGAILLLRRYLPRAPGFLVAVVGASLAVWLLGLPLASYMPLASLAAVLVIVAWNMSEIDKFRSLLSAPSGDAVVLLVTFFLTVMVDLTVAIQVGVVMAAILFMHRMAQVVQVEKGVGFLQGDVDDAQIPALDYAFRRCRRRRGCSSCACATCR
jgi:MFS superfamily sulfate permease-like transporter